ncbi:nucleoporin-domain-containing protein [Pleomassaria siparia CBS 279.74]|uniref:Nucleoporin-domain-containing protein n=1 Tax=Pleomassaria siparia CBS 279.74 TaxID=1314801 RepID=A0A6G1KNH0_9PLEO|nr:nucleoporin-domain-containing protein [Pleomassaria siparia CBS 279.74]
MAANMPPATPQRQGPGAFINTPAPGRSSIFRQGPQQQQQQQQQPPAQLLPAPAAPVPTPVERAAKTIDEMLLKDERYPELQTYVNQGASGDYQESNNPAWTPFQRLRTYEVPERIFEQVNHTQMTTSMGLFAEINHAWVAIDNQLYLWDYTHPNPELVGYEEQANNIVTVKLVKPRAKVFVDNISYILVVATTADIFLIAVECQRGPEGVHTVTLYRTGLTVSIRGIHIKSVEGSDETGRIFFADGRDSEDVYELNYQQEDRWFSSRCSKTNHVRKSIGLPALSFYTTTKYDYVEQMAVDDSRKLLYTLSSNGTIRIFYMKTSSTLDLVITKTLPALRTLCSHVAPQAASSMRGWKIIGIDPITANEADQLSLVATTNNGCRVYLSTTSNNWMGEGSSAPNSMQVRHIRFPPPDSSTQNQVPSSSPPQFSNSASIDFNSQTLAVTERGFRYAPGSFFCFYRKANQGNDMLFMSAPHSGYIGFPQENAGPKYIETSQYFPLTGHMQAVGLVSDPFSASNKPSGFGNELAVQFDKPLSVYAIMTSTGIETVRRRRLVDTFAAIIKYGGGSNGMEGDIRKIAKQYGQREIAATSLAVACGQGSDVGPDARIAKVSDPEVLEFARKTFIEWGGKAQLSEIGMVEGINVENVRASPRHDGIAIYISRLVRSIWRTPIIKDVKKPAGIVFEPTHKIAKLQEIQRALVQLQEFLDSNKSMIDGLAGPEALGRVTSRQDEVELQGENRALMSLVHLINNIVEGIAFVLVLFEERLEDIMILLPDDSQLRVRQLTFQGLFSVKEGKDLAKELVKAIVNRNIMKGSNVETVAEALRRKCGSFCSSDDVVIFKAQENLKKATDVGANAERGRMLLNDSLRLFEQVAKSLSSEHLTAAVNKYVQLEFYAGAIRLALKVAQELDRGNKALSWIKDGQPVQDVRQVSYLKRTACYELVFRVIEAVDLASSNQGVVQDGVISQITRRKQEAYEQINNSDDEVFQNYLYDWYLSQDWAERLLQIDSPFVVDYLRRSSEIDLTHADLLWRYYAHYNDYLSAAEVQFGLAKSAFNLSLEKRIEYLSRAKANASTRMAGFTETGVRNRQSRQELLRSINEHLDIANIQDDVLQKIRNDKRLTGERRKSVLENLDGAVQPLDELYHAYADQAGYYDICLLIYHSADYRSLPDIRSTWTNLVEQIHRNAVEEKQGSPWELVSLKVEDIGRRVSLSENVFPVNIVLQILLQYDLTFYTHEPNQRATNADNTLLRCDNLRWPIDVFVRLNAPFESLVSTLEALWYAQEHPFGGRNRKMLVKWLIYTVEKWHEGSRRSGQQFGGAENAIALSDLLRTIVGASDIGTASLEDREWNERGREVRAKVEIEAAR